MLIFQHPLPQNGQLQKYVDQKLVETVSKFAIFQCTTSDCRFVTWFMSIKFGLSRLSFEVFFSFEQKQKLSYSEPF